MSWNPRFRRTGFTLIELLVVIAIIATLASVVAPSVFRNVSDARRSAATAQLQIFALALDSYRIDLAAYPSTDEGLDALRVEPHAARGRDHWRGPYLRQRVPLDPWGRPYHYEAPGRVNRDSYDLYSLGRDGRVGGEDEDKDITSWGGEIPR